MQQRYNRSTAASAQHSVAHLVPYAGSSNLTASAVGGLGKYSGVIETHAIFRSSARCTDPTSAGGYARKLANLLRDLDRIKGESR